MARPRAKELTERELEIMHLFWEHGELTAHDVRERLGKSGRELAYTTVATLIKILTEKQFIEQTNDERPFTYQPIRSFDDVSGNLLTDILNRVFRGSREQLLIRLMDQKKLSPDVVQYISDQVDKSRLFYKQAEDLAWRSEYETAIKTQEQAIKHLVRALQRTGMMVRMNGEAQ